MSQHEYIQPFMTIRIDFSKKNESKYISHLDLQRAFMRLLRRTDIPIWLTQGFNPHPYLNFCSPLSVGMEGDHELLDLKLASSMDFDEIKVQLNENMPRGLIANEVYESKNSFNDVFYASYTIKLGLKTDVLNSFFEREAIPVIKKTKKSEISLDLKKECSVKNIIDNESDGCCLEAIFSNNQSLNVSPLLLINALKEYTDLKRFSITRNHFLRDDYNIFR